MNDAFLSTTNNAIKKAMRIKPFLLLLVMNTATLTAAPLDLGNFQKTPWHGMQAVNGYGNMNGGMYGWDDWDDMYEWDHAWDDMYDWDEPWDFD